MGDLAIPGRLALVAKRVAQRRYGYNQDCLSGTGQADEVNKYFARVCRCAPRKNGQAIRSLNADVLQCRVEAMASSGEYLEAESSYNPVELEQLERNLNLSLFPRKTHLREQEGRCG